VTVDRWDSRVEHDDFTQPGNLYRLMSDDEQERLAHNVAAALGGCRSEIVERQCALFDQVDEEYGRRVRQAIESGATRDHAAQAVKDSVVAGEEVLR
jgi:catalase